jgi:hypothetical protein
LRSSSSAPMIRSRASAKAGAGSGRRPNHCGAPLRLSRRPANLCYRAVGGRGTSGGGRHSIGAGPRPFVSTRRTGASKGVSKNGSPRET